MMICCHTRGDNRSHVNGSIMQGVSSHAVLLLFIHFSFVE